MKFKNYLYELSSHFGAGISFIDIDDTLFHTFAMIKVKKNGKVVRKLTNQEFNGYELKDGESFDFGEFGDAKLFKETSIPIPKTINRIKRMFKNIDKRGSKVVLLTARADFDDKETFLQVFRDVGIPIDKIYVERAGNLKTGTIPEKKERIILKYLKTGIYRRVRLLDDHIGNIKQFISMQYKLPQDIINKVKEIHGIEQEESIPPIQFFGLWVKDDGSLQRIK